MKRRLSVTNLSLESNLLTFWLNAPVVIRAEVKRCKQALLFIAMYVRTSEDTRHWRSNASEDCSSLPVSSSQQPGTSSPVSSHFFTSAWWWLECSVETSASYMYFPSSSWQQAASSSFMQKPTEKLQVNTVLSIVARCNGSSKVLLCTYMYTNETRTALHVTTCCHAPTPPPPHPHPTPSTATSGYTTIAKFRLLQILVRSLRQKACIQITPSPNFCDY